MKNNDLLRKCEYRERMTPFIRSIHKLLLDHPVYFLYFYMNKMYNDLAKKIVFHDDESKSVTFVLFAPSLFYWKESEKEKGP